MFFGSDVLLCHDDELEGRRIAFILYLVPEWSEEDGGTGSSSKIECCLEVVLLLLLQAHWICLTLMVCRLHNLFDCNCIFVCMIVCTFVCIFVCTSVRYVCIHLFVCLSVRLFICLYGYLYV